MLFLHWQQRPSPGESSTLTDQKRWAISSQGSLEVCTAVGRQENFSLGSAAQDSIQAPQLEEFTWHRKAPHYSACFPNAVYDAGGPEEFGGRNWA